MTPRSATLSRRPRAAVTGGAGFIGSHLVDRLVGDGYDVLAIDDLSSGSVSNVAADATLEQLDIATADLDRLLRTWRAEVVYHLAAQASVVRSSLDPLRDLEVNVVGTHRVATAAATSGARILVFVSSGGAIYGETPRVATERTLPAPTSHYGVHKLAAEGHVRLAGLSTAILRPSNVYGSRQAGGLEGAVVASFIKQALGEATIQIHGDGRQSRDFVQVLDVVEALCLVAHEPAGTGVLNVATGRGTSVAALADHVELATGRSLERTFGPRRQGDVMNSVISAAALRRLGWRPTVALDAGLAALVRAARAGV